MNLIDNPERSQWPQLTGRPQLELDYLESAVKNVLVRVKKSGDAALKELTAQFDHVSLSNLLVTEEEILNAIKQIPENLKDAIRIASENIKKFHSAQRREVVKIETTPGVFCWRKGVAIQKVGIYIPGGTAPLFSTVLMLGIPAQLAGCEEIILCTPPNENGKVNDAILFTADLVGIKKIFKAGGSQAIAAMAYGTESIPKVSKIFGPGNQYVTKAKQLVNQEGTAIDMPAGPSEVLVLADETANPKFVAADLLSQAEHGTDSQVILVANEKKIVLEVLNEVDAQLASLPRQNTAKEALANSRAIVLKNEEKQIDFINEYAPEHLIINTRNSHEVAEKIINAGSIFLGAFTPESAGDYASGTNHTLPTNGYAKAYGGVSLESFMKYITIQEISKKGIQELGPSIIAMAEAEQLSGHAEAVRVRL